MSERDLLVLGDINPDVILTGAAEPVFGQAEVLVEDARMVIGGSGAIMACAAAKLGLRTAIVGVVGDDAAGRWMLAELSEAGVDTRSCILDAGTPTGMSVVLSRSDDRAILTARGTTSELRAGHIAPETIAGSRHVHASSYFLQGSLAPDLAEVFELARDRGVATSLDPNWDPSGRWNGGFREVARHASIVFVNATEAMGICGVDDPGEAADALAIPGTTAVVKLGSGGALAVRGEDRSSVPALPVEVVDTTGAGDTFDAAFLAGFLRGWELQRCLALAVACGSLSTRGLGGTASQPALQEALEAIGNIR